MLAVWFTVRHITGPMWPLSFPTGCSLQAVTRVSHALPNSTAPPGPSPSTNPTALRHPLTEKVLSGASPSGVPRFTAMLRDEGSFGGHQQPPAEQSPGCSEGSGQWHSMGRLLFIPHFFPLLTNGTHTSSSPTAAHHPLGPKTGTRKGIQKGSESSHSRQLPQLKRSPLSLGKSFQMDRRTPAMQNQ